MNKLTIAGILSLLLISCNSPLIKKVNEKLDHYIAASSLNNMLINKESVLIIDLRRPILYNDSHIPGAINIQAHNIDTLTNRFTTLVFIVIYDENTAYAKPALKKVHYLGYSDAQILSGGYPSWTYKSEKN